MIKDNHWASYGVAYLCDKKACDGACPNSECHHTCDITHAVNFQQVDTNGDLYFERRKEMKNLELLKTEFNGEGSYHILFGESGYVDIYAKTAIELTKKYLKHLKKCPKSDGYVHCVTKIGGLK